MLATFPQYPALEARYGSVIRGTRSALRERQRASVAAVKSATPTKPFVSLDGGIHMLVDALVSQLSGSLRLHCAVDRVERTAGGGYRVAQTDGAQLMADAVILATPANVAAALLRESAPTASAHLGEIGYGSIGNAYLAFRRSDVPDPLDGYGMVIPHGERRRIDGMSWTSSKWVGRAPADHALLRIFFGGPHTRELTTLDDKRVLAIVRAELEALLGIKAPPLFQRVYRWQDGYPQYTVGHLARVEALNAALPSGLLVTGSAYRGIGVPDCVRQGQEAAQQVVAALKTLSVTTAS
jgi:oxygen-dependent protoporphyrinogen oxidase